MLPPSIQIKTLKDIGFDAEIPETGKTLEENAAIKARTIYDLYKMPVFADDTGLEVETLGGRPGVYSARYAGEGAGFQDNYNKLLFELKGLNNRNAAFRTVFCFIDASGSEAFFEGSIEGEITTTPVGSNGFGYDPVFRPLGQSKTFAEMSADEKNACSHRARAVQNLVGFLSDL